MGALLSLRKQDAPDPGAGIFIDFENVKASDSEASVYERVAKALEPSKDIIAKLSSYDGCSEAISNPSKDTEAAAWELLKPSVIKLKELYEYSNVFSDVIPILLNEICQESPIKSMESKQAISKLLADILYFVLQFDDLKVGNPNIQNDFSYYRRSMAKMKSNPQVLQELVVKDDLANKMSLFFAYPTPMLRSVIEVASKYMKSSPEKSSNVLECFSVMTSICTNAISKNRITTASGRLYCLRVMVACIVLYDHLDDHGVFVKDSQVKNSIKVIESDGGDNKTNLLNAIRYSSKHFGDETTPKAIKTLLGS